MAQAYVQKWLADEKRKAVNTIRRGPHVPRDRQYHREPSARLKTIIATEPSDRLKAIIDAKARVQEAQLEEFKKLNDQQTLLNDVDYMRWVYLHPHFSSIKKNMIETRREQIDRRERVDTTSKKHVSRKTKQEMREKLAKFKQDTKKEYAKGLKIPTVLNQEKN